MFGRGLEEGGRHNLYALMIGTDGSRSMKPKGRDHMPEWLNMRQGGRRAVTSIHRGLRGRVQYQNQVLWFSEVPMEHLQRESGERRTRKEMAERRLGRSQTTSRTQGVA